MEHDETTKQKNIEIIVELLMKAQPNKVYELLIFIKNYIS